MPEIAESKSDSNDGYSNFEESNKGENDADVSTQKKASQSGKANSDKKEALAANDVASQDGYSSIEEHDAIENEVDKKF